MTELEVTFEGWVVEDIDELEKARKEIKRLEDENAALRKMLSAMALQGKQGW